MREQFKLPDSDLVIDLAPGAGELKFGHLVLGEDPNVELCTGCFHSALTTWSVHMVSAFGVGDVGTITRCVICSPLSPEAAA